MLSHQLRLPFFGPDMISDISIIRQDMYEATRFTRFTRFVEARIAGGHLLVKTEIYIYVNYHDCSHGLHLVRQVIDNLGAHIDHDPCCQHNRWTDLYPSLFKSIPVTTEVSLSELSPKACPHCYTDYVMAFQSYRILRGFHRLDWVLTSWKDLGSGRSPHEPEWKSHHSIVPVPQDQANSSNEERDAWEERKLESLWDENDATISTEYEGRCLEGAYQSWLRDMLARNEYHMRGTRRQGRRW